MRPGRPGCPRCPALLDARVVPAGAADVWTCPDHGETAPLWRAEEPSYDELAAHLLATAGLPTYLPWPIGAGWSVTDLARVGHPGAGLATLTCCSGPTDVDGPVDVLVVSEEAGTGLGARVAGVGGSEPLLDLTLPPQARLRVEATHAVPLWVVPAEGAALEQDRSVVVGEALGRWLWVVLRPASALLLLNDDLVLRDVSGLGPALLEVPFGRSPPLW